MGLFKKKQENLSIQPPISSRVEIELQKNATREATQKAVEANQKLNDLLIENGFTLKIYLAAGGKTKKG